MPGNEQLQISPPPSIVLYRCIVSALVRQKKCALYFVYFIETSDAFQILQFLLRVCTQKKWKRDDKNLDGLPIEYIIIKRVSEDVWVGSGSKASIDDFFILVDLDSQSVSQKSEEQFTIIPA